MEVEIQSIGDIPGAVTHHSGELFDGRMAHFTVRQDNRTWFGIALVFAFENDLGAHSLVVHARGLALSAKHGGSVELTELPGDVEAAVLTAIHTANWDGIPHPEEK